MSICSNPYAILPISLKECIGLSLNTINGYFSLINEEACAQYDEIAEISTELLTLSSQFYTLSSGLNGLPKAYVTFSGGLSNQAQALEIFHSYNVSAVEVAGPGEYRVKFTDEFKTEQFAILTTCSQLLTSNSYVFASTTTSTVSAGAGIKITNREGIPATPTLVAASFFY